MLADLMVKHAAPLVPLDPATAARDLAERSGADGLILTGLRTGLPVDVEQPVDAGRVRALRRVLDRL